MWQPHFPLLQKSFWCLSSYLIDFKRPLTVSTQNVVFLHIIEKLQYSYWNKKKQIKYYKYYLTYLKESLSGNITRDANLKNEIVICSGLCNNASLDLFRTDSHMHVPNLKRTQTAYVNCCNFNSSLQRWLSH